MEQKFKKIGVVGHGMPAAFHYTALSVAKAEKMTDDAILVNLSQKRLEILGNYNQDIIRQRESQLIDRLKELGYSFENRILLENFLKTRCRIEKSELNKECSLFADNKLVATWYDTIDIQVKTNEKGEISATAIYGNPPH